MFLLRIIHTFFGHPKKDCKKWGALGVKCKCGTIITHSDMIL